MVSLQQSPSIHQTLLRSSFTQLGLYRHGQFRRGGVPLPVKAEQVSAAASTSCHQGGKYTSCPVFHLVKKYADKPGRRHLLAVGAIAVPWFLSSEQTSISFAAENTKGFLGVTDKKDGYSFVYPFGWQEIVIEGQDKVFKDVIEPLENVSVNVFPTSKGDIHELGSPKEVAEALIKKVLAPPSQKTKLIDAAEHDVDGKAYYTFEFVAQAPNFTRHAISTICIGNGKFYTLTTGANERRWEKMKDKLHTVVDSFKIFNV